MTHALGMIKLKWVKKLNLESNIEPSCKDYCCICRGRWERHMSE